MKELRLLPARTLYLLGLLGAAKAAALIGLATAIAGGVVAVATHHAVGSLLALGLVAAIARALIAWAQRFTSSRALLGQKERLRSALAARAVGGDDGSPAAIATLATQGLDELDKYYTVYLPALVTAATVPLIVGARILFADWVSALILVLTVPLIPVFMALIGMHTRERVELASTQLSRLSEHLVELARGLPVLVGLGRAGEQTEALRDLSERHRRTTVGTLRTAFLSSLALELIATISVAVVAVFIGVRLVAGDMPLEVGLLVLILAPECMAPLREIGVAFHASQDGREALRRAQLITDAPSPAPTSAEATPQRGAPTSSSAHASDLRELAETTGEGITVARLSVRFADRAEVAVDEVRFTAREGVTLLDGRSGAGKSTVLAVLAGGIRSGVTGTVAGIDPARVAWLPQHPRISGSTVADELELYGGPVSLLARVGLAHLADADPAAISPGELRRLAFARVLARVADGATTVLLDEPTAQLDAANADLVIAEIARMSATATVIVASHDEVVRALATSTVSLGSASRGTRALVAHESQAQPIRARAAVQRGSAWRELRRFLGPVRGRMVGAVVLGALAALFAIALTGLSGWLIVRAAEHPPIMYLLVAIVGVRFFGIGRAALRYCERLVGHDAVFGALTGLRLRVWASLATGTDRTQLAAGATLDRLVRDVDRVRDLSLRVVLPVIVGPVVMIAVVIAAALLSPTAVPLFIALAVCMLVLAPMAAVWGDRKSTASSQHLRSVVLRRLAAALTASDDLRGNGVAARVLGGIAALDRRAGTAERTSASALGLGGAVVVAAGAASAVLATTLGGTDSRIVAVLALVSLAIIEPMLDYVAAVQLVPAFRLVLREVSTEPEQPRSRHGVQRPITSVELHGVSAGWQQGVDVVTDVAAVVSRGDWLAITGPSGSGKSTVAAVLLGQLSPSSGRYLVDGVDASALDLTGAIGWCPQEAHLFDSTVRGNLRIARARPQAPSDDELRGVLDRVGLSALLAGMPAGLDTRVGREGAQLSGGERQRLAVARALLTGADVVVLDEPTAHLDDETASVLMADLRVALADRITVLVTHHAVDLREGDARLRLGALPAPANVGGRP
ncbi:thiol reductant ABC exporter subunit CydC [soil metagenome]